jgi:hypothetical protein
MSAGDYSNPRAWNKPCTLIIGNIPDWAEVKVNRILLLAFLLFLYTLQGFSSPQNPPSRQLPGMPPSQENPEPTVPDRMQRDMEKKANEQRQAELKRDTEKLVRLSTELKDYVDKTDQNVLSVEVVKKAEEIEHLAHSVKTKMRDGH